MFVSMMMLLSVTNTAEAGKLAEGFRGVPYGPASVLDVPPGENCAANTESGVRWNCQVRLGEANVEVAYMVQEGLFFGLVIHAEGYGNSTAFFDVLVAGYGAGAPANTYDETKLADRRWLDGNVVGSWDYNKYSDKARFIVYDQTLMAKIKAIEADRAKAAASGL